MATSIRKSAAKKSSKTSRSAGMAKPKARARVNPIPDQYAGINAVLRIDGAARAIDYYAQVFGARVRMRLDMPDGRVGHAELKIGKALFMLSDEYPEMSILGPKSVGGASVALQLYVRDCDEILRRGERAGGKIIRPAKDEFYGDRSGMLEDPFGHLWMIQTHIEDVSPAIMKKRLKALG